MITRRKTLHMTLAGAAGAVLGQDAPLSLPAPVASRVVDAHTHFYDPTRPQGVPWPGKGSALYRPVYPKDWAAVAEKAGVRETIVVESSPWPADNDWILNLAAKEKSIVGYIGHLLPGSGDFAKELKRLAANPLFRGVRVTGDELRTNIGTPGFLEGAKLLAEMDLMLEVGGLEDLGAVAKFAEKVPALRVVLGCLGGPGNPQAPRPGWKEGIAAAAKARNVSCKVCAIADYEGPAEGKAPTDTGFYLPVLNPVWEAFGEERLMFGSNWPVCEKGTTYEALVRLLGEFTQSRSKEASERFFWKNSRAICKWTERK